MASNHLSTTTIRPLSLDLGDANGGGDNDDNSLLTSQEEGPQQQPLDERIIAIIESIPDLTIRPGRLAAELGISVEDASAELCGLLAAVGGGSNGATFRFEKQRNDNDNNNGSGGEVLTMVFTFPPDFRKRAINKRRRDDWWQSILSVLKVVVKGLKVMTAAGLILSLIIVSIAIMAGLIAALIALSRSDSRRQHSALTSQIYRAFYTIRQLLWCYALFGPTGNEDDANNNGQDPFLREVAYDVWLLTSICCGNPGSIFYWMRASQLNQRRSRVFRGWAPRNRGYASNQSELVPGVTVFTRNRDGTTSDSLPGTSEHRGLLSVAVEFLFGPSPFVAAPLAEDIWKLRAAHIMQTASKNPNDGVSLESLAPYVDAPPENPEDSITIMNQGLLIVSFFNGVPVTNDRDDMDEEPNEASKLRSAKFIFPELMAESLVASRFDYHPEPDDGTWDALLCSTSTSTTSFRQQSRLPSYLREERYKFSKLTRQQFLHCVGLGCLNLMGVLWFGQSISAGGILDLSGSPLQIPLRKGLYPVLRFYALLFFVIPAGRLALIMVLNSLRKRRNERRARLVRHPTSNE